MLLKQTERKKSYLNFIYTNFIFFSDYFRFLLISFFLPFFFFVLFCLCSSSSISKWATILWIIGGQKYYMSVFISISFSWYYNEGVTSHTIQLLYWCTKLFIEKWSKLWHIAKFYCSWLLVMISILSLNIQSINRIRPDKMKMTNKWFYFCSPLSFK